MTDQEKHFALFVQSVPGHLVRRFGTPENIGATVTKTGPVWTPQIVALTHAEVSAYEREYATALRDGALVKKKVSDFEAQCQAEAAPAPVMKKEIEP